VSSGVPDLAYRVPVERELGARTRLVVTTLLSTGLILAALSAPSQAQVIARPDPAGGGAIVKVAPTTVMVPAPKPKPKPPPSPEPPPAPSPEPGPSPTEPPAPQPVVAPPLSVRVITFNVLGTSHTRGPDGRPGGVARIGGAARLIAGTPIVGLQELQTDQAAAIARRLPGYGLFPGNSMGRPHSDNTLMWRQDLFTAVQLRTIGIPYHGGRIRQMPYVKLRHVSGTEVWVANFHNPATTVNAGNNARWRRVAVQKEIALARALQADGTPVIFTGDFNDRGGFFCPVVRSGALRAANGGDAGPGFCNVPGGAPIDWIMGSPDITWSDYSASRSGPVRWASDHPLVAATATIPEQVLNQEELAAAGVG
jgi:endonuclease/exonuclease/phosphatase family metal-dependent hydrolase